MAKILVLDSGGSPKNWIPYEKAAYHYCKGNVSWVAGENEITITGGVNKISNTQSRLAINSIVAIASKTNVYKPPILTNSTLFARDGATCAYCGNRYPFTLLTRDHIIPKSKGGKNTWTNCVTSCKPCNGYKDSKTLDQLGMKLRYTPYALSRAEYLIYTNNKITDDQLQFLIAQCPENSRVQENLKILSETVCHKKRRK